MYWERREGDSIETGNGVFNGEIGTITNINEKEKNIRKFCYKNAVLMVIYS